jgi:iron complex outermembrane receptor protein/vitamin B12 transporter
VKSLLTFVRRSIPLLLLLQLAFTPRAHAADQAEISGVVVDQLGGRVPGARVQVLRAGVPVHDASSDGAGAFRVSGLEAGRYAVAARAEGFAARTTPDFFLAAGGTQSLEVRLDVGPLAQQVFVTASVGAVPASQAGAPATVVDLAALEVLGYVDVQNAIRTVPGVQVVQSGGRGATTALFVRGGSSNFNKILVDGVPANDIGGAFDFADVTTAGIDSVEVLRGSNSVRFGTDALAGVVSLETARGRTRVPEAVVSLDGGNFGTGRAELSVGGAASRTDYFVDVARLTTDNAVANDDYAATTVAARAGTIVGKGTRLGFTLRRLDGTRGNPNAVNYFGISDDARVERTGTFASVSADSLLTERWRTAIRLTSAGQSYEYSNPAPTGDAFNPFGFGAVYVGRPVTIRGANGYSATGRAILDYGGTYPSRFASRVTRRLLSAEATYEPAARLAVGGGLRVEDEHGESNAGTPTATDRLNYGGFGEVRASAMGRVFVTAGIGLDHNAIFGNAATPRVSLAAYLRPPTAAALGETKITVNAGKGIKEPSLFQELSSLYGLLPAGAPARAGVSPIGAEKSRSLDVGVEQGLSGGRVRVRVAYFDNTFTDLVEFVSRNVLPRIGVPAAAAAATPFGAYVNSQSNRARGIELSGEAAVGTMRVAGAYMFLDAVVTQSLSSGALSPAFNPAFPGVPIGAYSPLVGARPFRRPTHSGSVTATYARDRAQVGLAAYLFGRQDDSTFLTDEFFGNSLLLPNKDLDPAYQRVDLTGSYRLHPRLRWFVAAENVFNERYEPVAGFPALSRAVRSGIAVTLGGDGRP